MPEQTEIDERIILTVEQAEAMLPKGDRVHTFRSNSIMLIGADWDRVSVLGAFEKYGVELSGEKATAMKHGLVFIDEDGPCFIETAG